jgi:hypothetical protein
VTWAARIPTLGGSWSPAFLGSSLLGFWDAERTDKLTLSGSSVTTWTDVVGNYAATQGVGASKPVWSATSFNGRPGITFDGSDDELTLASVPFPTGANACEIWGLVDQQTAAADLANRTFFSYGGNATTTMRAVQKVGGSAIPAVRTGNGATAPQQTNGNVATDYFLGRHVVRAVISATDQRVDINAIAGGAAAVVPATGSTRSRLGARTTDVAAEYFGGQIAALLVTSPLSSDQATQLYAYLKARGGTP